MTLTNHDSIISHILFSDCSLTTDNNSHSGWISFVDHLSRIVYGRLGVAHCAILGRLGDSSVAARPPRPRCSSSVCASAAPVPLLPCLPPPPFPPPLTLPSSVMTDAVVDGAAPAVSLPTWSPVQAVTAVAACLLAKALEVGGRLAPLDHPP